jgi:hypothetical protein
VPLVARRHGLSAFPAARSVVVFVVDKVSAPLPSRYGTAAHLVAAVEAEAIVASIVLSDELV